MQLAEWFCWTFLATICIPEFVAIPRTAMRTDESSEAHINLESKLTPSIVCSDARVKSSRRHVFVLSNFRLASAQIQLDSDLRHRHHTTGVMPGAHLG
jgi:hypothetical protein